MLELDDRAVAVRPEHYLYLGLEVGVVAPLGVELPGEQGAVRLVPGQHPAPFIFGSVLADLVPAPAGPRLDDDVGLRRSEQAVPLRPPAAHAAEEDAERLVLRRAHAQRLAD